MIIIIMLHTNVFIIATPNQNYFAHWILESICFLSPELRQSILPFVNAWLTLLCLRCFPFQLTGRLGGVFTYPLILKSN